MTPAFKPLIASASPARLFFPAPKTIVVFVPPRLSSNVPVLETGVDEEICWVPWTEANPPVLSLPVTPPKSTLKVEDPLPENEIVPAPESATAVIPIRAAIPVACKAVLMADATPVAFKPAAPADRFTVAICGLPEESLIVKVRDC